MRSTARACFRRPKISEFCAHTRPEDGDASKPGPTCDATEPLGSRAKERAVQKHRSRAARSPGPTASRPGLWGSQKQNTRKIVLKKK
jgi:hypothetical protein